MAKQAEVIISLAIIALIVTALVGSLATEALNRTSKIGVNSESQAITCATDGNITDGVTYTVTNPPAGWEIDDCPLTSFVLKNESGTEYTLDTDYTLSASRGTFVLLNTTATSYGFCGGAISHNKTYVTYYYCGDGYVNSSWGRTLLNYAPGFIVVALLVSVVAGVYILLERKKNED